MNLALYLLADFLEGLHELHFLVFSLVSHALGRAGQFEQRLLQAPGDGGVGVFALLDFALDGDFQVWEILGDTLSDDLETFFSRLLLFFDVTLQELLFLPDGVSGALEALLASLRGVCKAFLQELLALRYLSLTLVQLLRLVPPLCIKEVNDLGKLTVNVIKLLLGTVNNFLEDVLELCQLPLVFHSAARLRQSQGFLQRESKLSFLTVPYVTCASLVW